jgi:hypothetical protein
MTNPIKAARTGVLTYINEKSHQLLTTTRKERKAAKKSVKVARKIEKLERRLNRLQIPLTS